MFSTAIGRRTRVLPAVPSELISFQHLDGVQPHAISFGGGQAPSSSVNNSSLCQSIESRRVGDRIYTTRIESMGSEDVYVFS
ncbi:hypothetical protein M6B38_142430 [Iris pallida]|uniref:Uncharacterized protein n=1 Tax=Iris pallida TaxID=29817 RepID=A0AAX6E1B9_IRIPA|nr:hypothetical protein M6B38_218160 [Iris pallida]KAJ6813634.1 hypothetical protein M6B38_142430 [Iris pallida]